MKKLILAASIFAFAVSAQAATLTEIFTSTDGKVFSLHDVRQVESNGMYVTLVHRDGGSTGGYLQDVGGTVYAKIVASEGFAKSYVKIANVPKYINVNAAKYIYCNASTGVLTVGWNFGAPSEFADVGCVVYNQIKALGN